MQPTPRHNPLGDLYERLVSDNKGGSNRPELRAHGRDSQTTPIYVKTRQAKICVPETRLVHIANAKVQLRELLEASVRNQLFPEPGLAPEKFDAFNNLVKSQTERIWSSTKGMTFNLDQPTTPVHLEMVEHWVGGVQQLQPLTSSHPSGSPKQE